MDKRTKRVIKQMFSDRKKRVIKRMRYGNQETLKLI